MSRKPLIRTSYLPYHVVSRSNNREFFPISLYELWEECVLQLNMIYILYHAQVHAFVLMGNHYHMLLTTPKQNLDSIMRYFNHSLAITINKKSGRINRVFGSRYKWSLVRDERYFGTVLKYIYQNPIKAKLVNRVELYRFSTIREIIGQSRPVCPLYPLKISKRFSNMLPWEFLQEMNEYLEQDLNEKMMKALQRSTFKISKR